MAREQPWGGMYKYQCILIPRIGGFAIVSGGPKVLWPSPRFLGQEDAAKMHLRRARSQSYEKLDRLRDGIINKRRALSATGHHHVIQGRPTHGPRN